MTLAAIAGILFGLFLAWENGANDNFKSIYRHTFRKRHHGGAISPWFALSAVAAAMVAGGILSVKKVAETMALKVTKMNHGRGFCANLIASFLVIVASKFGVPVSTTHVSCGSLIGIGAATKQAHWKTIGGIVLAWIITLPLGGLSGALFYFLISQMS